MYAERPTEIAYSDDFPTPHKSLCYPSSRKKIDIPTIVMKCFWEYTDLPRDFSTLVCKISLIRGNRGKQSVLWEIRAKSTHEWPRVTTNNHEWDNLKKSQWCYYDVLSTKLRLVLVLVIIEQAKSTHEWPPVSPSKPEWARLTMSDYEWPRVTTDYHK